MMIHNSMNGGGLYSQMKTDGQYQGRRNGVLKAIILVGVVVALVATGAAFL